MHLLYTCIYIYIYIWLLEQVFNYERTGFYSMMDWVPT